MKRGWDSAVFSEAYSDAESKAKSADPKNAWRDPRPTAVRVFLGRSTDTFLSTGRFLQVIRNPPDDTRDEALYDIELITCDRDDLVGKTIREDSIKPLRGQRRFQTTAITVANKDSLEAVRDIQKSEPREKVVCLNMANAFDAGGGWRRGRLAQEESLFYRTALSRSLEKEKYPFGEFTCFVTRDVTVVRDDVDKGFRFKDPGERWKLNFITMAAFKLKDPRDFTTEQAVRTRAKIESLFAICANEGMEHLVLSALGCGAFKNPPDYVADIFKAVMFQFAGFFKTICFAIKDSERGTNVVTFAQKLVSSSITALRPGETTRPLVVDNDLSLPVIPSTDVAMGICRYGGECNTVDEAHCRRFVHPPACPDGRACKCRDGHHSLLFTHPILCKYAEGCRIMYSGSEAAIRSHEERCFHLDRCPGGSQCEHIGDDDHRRKFMHPPECPEGKSCEKINDPEHTARWCHSRCKACKFGLMCPYFADAKHMALYEHPFPPLCPEFFKCNQVGSREHLDKFSHVCPKGPYCTSTDERHLREYRHLGLPKCKNGSSCADYSEYHLSHFGHPSCSYPRKSCTTNTCLGATDSHKKNLIHYSIGLYRNSPIASALPQLFNGVRFSSNMAALQSRIDTNGEMRRLLDSSLGKAVRRLVRNAKPVVVLSEASHRAMASFGCLYSPRTILEMASNPARILNSSKFQSTFDRILREITQDVKDSVKSFAYNYIVLANYYNAQKLRIAPAKDRPYLDHGRSQIYNALQKIRFQNPQDIKAKLPLNPDALDELEGLCKDLSDTLFAVISEYCGSQEVLSLFNPGLDDTVQGFVGFAPESPPSTTGYVVILDQNILAHKDTVILPCSPQWFLEGRCGELRGWFGYRNDPMESMRASALSLNNRMVYDLIAFELIIRASTALQRPPDQLIQRDFVDALRKSLPQTFFSVHLPGCIPEGYVYKDLQVTPEATTWTIAYKEMDNFPPLGEVIGTTFNIPCGVSQEITHLCPVQIPTDCDDAYVYFSVLGDLTVLFNASGSSILRICIARKGVSIEAQGYEPAGADDFDSMCEADSFKHYMVHLDYKKGCATIKHYNSSEVFSCASLCVKIPAVRYCDIGVSAQSGAIISNLFTSTEDLSLRIDEPEVQDPRRLCSTRLSSSDVPPSFCPSMLNCQIVHNPNGRDYRSHTTEFRHVCRFDKDTCRSINDPKHCKFFVHLTQDKVCRDGDRCRKLDDPKHRMEKRHAGLPWLMIPCNAGERCTQKNDPEHIKKYVHKEYDMSTKRIFELAIK